MIDSLQPTEPVSENFDLHYYAHTAVRQFRIVLAVTIAAALIAFGATFIRGQSYEASALLAVTTPQYVVSLNPLSPGQPREPNPADIPNALLLIATSDDVLNSLVTSPLAAASSVESVPDLRLKVSATLMPSANLLVLRARGSQPQEASALANAWADLLVSRGRELYGQSDQDLQYFQVRQQTADQELTKAGSALTEFQARNQINDITVQLNALEQQEQSYLTDRGAIAQLKSDVLGLRRRFDSYVGDSPVTLGDNVTALLLEMKTYNAAATLQLQLPTGASATPGKVSDLRTALDAMDVQLTSRASLDDTRLNEIHPQLLVLQSQIQHLQNEADSRTLRRDIAKASYQALVIQTEQVRLASQRVDPPVKIAGHAVPPRDPTPSRLASVGAAAAVGLFLGLCVVLLLEWWRRRRVPVPGSATLPFAGAQEGTIPTRVDGVRGSPH